jgi:hypothetical protein
VYAGKDLGTLDLTITDEITTPLGSGPEAGAAKAAVSD